MSKYHVRVVDQNNNLCYYLNAIDNDDIYRQAYKFVNDNPDTSMIGIERKEIFVILNSYTRNLNTIGIIGDNRINNNAIIHQSYNAYNAQSYNAYNAYNANNAYIFHTQRNELKKIAQSIVSDHTKKYGDICKYGNKCRFNCKFRKKCNRPNCVYHHFPIN